MVKQFMEAAGGHKRDKHYTGYQVRGVQAVWRQVQHEALGDLPKRCPVVQQRPCWVVPQQRCQSLLAPRLIAQNQSAGEASNNRIGKQSVSKPRLVYKVQQKTPSSPTSSMRQPVPQAVQSNEEAGVMGLQLGVLVVLAVVFGGAGCCCASVRAQSRKARTTGNSMLLARVVADLINSNGNGIQENVELEKHTSDFFDTGASRKGRNTWNKEKYRRKRIYDDNDDDDDDCDENDSMLSHYKGMLDSGDSGSSNRRKRSVTGSAGSKSAWRASVDQMRNAEEARTAPQAVRDFGYMDENLEI